MFNEHITVENDSAGGPHLMAILIEGDTSERTVGKALGSSGISPLTTTHPLIFQHQLLCSISRLYKKSGLRDLTTTKTPAASVAAALSRDTKLFERVAPSTYCVRASYRKDAGDAETIFAEARERICASKNGIPDVEDVDEAERDEDSESDVGDEPEFLDMGSLRGALPDIQTPPTFLNGVSQPWLAAGFVHSYLPAPVGGEGGLAYMGGQASTSQLQ